ncbi:MAG: sugar transferase [Lachnospiraceae bacterium]|nr:sugar transferase [Lachnospiraceae bacterium]
MELYYCENASLLFDIKILFKTVEAVIRKTGAQ